MIILLAFCFGAILFMITHKHHPSRTDTTGFFFELLTLGFAILTIIGATLH